MLADDGFHIGVLYRGVRLAGPRAQQSDIHAPRYRGTVRRPRDRNCRRRGRLIRWPQRREEPR